MIDLPDPDLTDLTARIEAMEPPDRLRLAAEALEARNPGLALMLVRRVEHELTAVLTVARVACEESD